MGYDNKVANTLMIIGILEIVAGILVGLSFGYERGGYSYSSEFHWPIFLLWAGIGTVSGIFVIGFAQIIELLHKINLKLVNEDEEKLNLRINNIKIPDGLNLWEEIENEREKGN